MVTGDDNVQDKSKLIAIAVIVLLFVLFLPTLIKSAKLLSPEVAPKEKNPEIPTVSEPAVQNQDELQKQLVPEESEPDIAGDQSGSDEAAAYEATPEEMDKIMPEDEFNINILDFIKLPE